MSVRQVLPRVGSTAPRSESRQGDTLRNVVLLATVQGAIVTQKFGPSHLGIEPAMWSTGDKAYWLAYAGASYFDDFHPGIDRSAVYGTPILAMEDGTVVWAGWKDGISGNQVEVEIRPNTRYSVNHLSSVACRVGQHVRKGSTIGFVGTSGATTGPHTHEGVSIREKDSAGVYRTFLYNPALFQAGGKFANDPRIQPERRYMQVNAPAVIWHAGRGYDESSDIYAYARNAHGDRPAGIYRRGRRIASLGYRFVFVRWTDTSLGRTAIVTGKGRRLAIDGEDCHFI